MRSPLSWLGAFLTLLAASPYAYSAGADKFRWNVGLQGGVALPSNSSTVFAFAGNGTYLFPFGLGVTAFFSRFSVALNTQGTTGNADAALSSIYTGLDPEYYFSGSLRGLHVGLRAGMGISSIEVAVFSKEAAATLSIKESSTFFCFGGKLGYDYFINRYSLGVELSNYIGSGDSSPSTVYFLLAAKFWL